VFINKLNRPKWSQWNYTTRAASKFN